MSKAPKYTFRVVEKRNKTWTAEIQRQATSKKKVVSKRQTGFASEAEGVVWAENELKQVLANHVARNKRHDDDRAEQYKDKLKKAELAAAKASLEADEQAEETVESEQSFTLSEAEQEKAISDLQELEQLETDDAEEELASKSDKLKFDFELVLEEEELAAKEASSKVKTKSETKVKTSIEDSSVEEVDESETADGAEVNSIYLQNK
ncbi:DUF3622 domain-containing protein [Thalassotalea psychrophila]|uniref:DUF3622 domain-containing protein n=1 Tax=Thalassotalea psychrophila TaxID=3065647 RepID=A0ABY9TWW7_9GAMM|nr:DUF3622 domain-containing protein [Colwelliaceae bacterium SQ149]